jgi:hypothetical protein
MIIFSSFGLPLFRFLLFIHSFIHSLALIVQDGPLASLFGISWSHTYRHAVGLLSTSDPSFHTTVKYYCSTIIIKLQWLKQPRSVICDETNQILLTYFRFSNTTYNGVGCSSVWILSCSKPAYQADGVFKDWLACVSRIWAWQPCELLCISDIKRQSDSSLRDRLITLLAQ